jgi:hypothetical protein
MQKFTNPNDPNNTQLNATLKRWISEKLQLSDGAVIEIQEHQCTDANCLHSETVFQVKNGENTEEGLVLYKIAKPLVFIRKWDVEGLKEVKR